MSCNDGTRIRVILEMSVSGRFSDDGQTISAEEVASYYVTTGERIDVRIGWMAVAPGAR